MKGEARIAPPASDTWRSHIQRVHGVVNTERLADVVQRRLNKIDEPVVKYPGHREAQTQVDGRVDDAFAQLVQVLHQAHARELRALGHCLSRLADCVCGINHAGLPAASGMGSSLWFKFCCRNSAAPGAPRSVTLWSCLPRATARRLDQRLGCAGWGRLGCWNLLAGGGRLDAWIWTLRREVSDGAFGSAQRGISALSGYWLCIAAAGPGFF